MDTINRIKHRQAIMGDASMSPDYPLAVLFARGKITREMYDAGMRFGSLHARIFGAPTSAAATWAKMYVSPDRTPEPISIPHPAGDMLDEANYAVMVATLDALPNPEVTRSVIRDLALYLKRDWYVDAILHHRKTGNAHLRRTALVREALQALADVDRVRADEGEVFHNPLRIRGRGEPAPRVA